MLGAMNELLDEYRALLEKVDRWFDGCCEALPDQIACKRGCSACCRGLFEISLLDAALLQQGFALLNPTVQNEIRRVAEARVTELQAQWPEFVHPYILNRLPHDDWQQMPEGDMTPCPLLDEAGLCRVYRFRPLVCRLHGLPNIDSSGESFSDEWCSLNFTGSNPLELTKLRAPFRDLFGREFDLLGDFARRQLGLETLELDTFIPSALLIDFARK